MRLECETDNNDVWKSRPDLSHVLNEFHSHVSSVCMSICQLMFLFNSADLHQNIQEFLTFHTLERSKVYFSSIEYSEFSNVERS